jgi:putative cell wall-binding protein
VVLAATGIAAVAPAAATAAPAAGTPTAPVYVAVGTDTSVPDLSRVLIGQGDGTPVDVAPGQWVDPTSTSVGPDGAVYVSDTGAGRLVRIDTNRSTKNLPLPTGAKPGAVTVDADNLVSVYDTAGQRILQIAPNGATRTVAVDAPVQSLTVGVDGGLYGYQDGAGRIVRITDAATTTVVDGVTGAKGLAVDSDGAFYTSFAGIPSLVQKITPDGTRTGIPGAWSMPSDVALGEKGSVYVANTGAGRIRIADADGSERVLPLVQGFTPTAVAVTPSLPTFVGTPPTAAALDKPFSFSFETAGVPRPIYGISNPAAVPGLAFNAATATLTGTPTAAGVYTFTVTAKNWVGDGSQTVTLTVGTAPAFGTIVAPATAKTGEPYTASFPATGSPAPTLQATGLPAGLALDSATGAISGTPQAAGTYTFSVKATNAIGTAQSADYKLTVSSGGPTTLTVDRVSGSDRFDTAIQVSKKAFAAGTADTVFVASGTSFADALAAGPVAAAKNGPVLLTAPGALSPGVAAEIRRLGADRIVVVGGTAAVSDSVLKALAAITDTVRVGGSDRFATSRAIAEYGFGSGGAKQAIVATGMNFPDALSAGAAIGKKGPVLLVNGANGDIDAETRALLGPKGLGVSTLWVAGGTTAVSTGIESALKKIAGTTRLAGGDRYATAQAINSAFFSGTTASHLLLATGSNFPDALAGGAWAAGFGGPLFLSQSGCVPQAVLKSITDLKTTRVTLLGGPTALSPAVERLTACAP